MIKQKKNPFQRDINELISNDRLIRIKTTFSLDSYLGFLKSY